MAAAPKSGITQDAPRNISVIRNGRDTVNVSNVYESSQHSMAKEIPC